MVAYYAPSIESPERNKQLEELLGSMGSLLEKLIK
jgi:hypothetical protein